MPRTCASRSSASSRAFSIPRSARSWAAFCESGSAISASATCACGLHEFLLARELQRLDDLIEIAVENFLEVVRGETNAVIGDAALRKIVRADLGRAIAGADLRFALARTLCFLRGYLRVEKTAAQDLERL